MIEKFLVALEDAIEQKQKRIDTIKGVLDGNVIAFELLREYRKQMLREISELEEDISELQGELRTIQRREAK